MALRTGAEILFGSAELRGKRIGLVCNPASVDGSFRHVVDLVLGSDNVTLGAIFGPQHGFRADVQDNMIETAHARDARRRVPVYSLYSETREPTAEMLHGLDLLVVDLQDVGTRVYTFAYTMANCLRAARQHHLPVFVCDRPNPIGGTAVEGPVLDAAYASFVGQFPIPMRHGLTMGELARLFNDHFGIGASLEVVRMEGWRRTDFQDETGLPWVMPSPNLPTLDSTIVYPGQVLLEGTTLSEGRGTTRPFELFGAPWIDPDLLAERLNARAHPGVHFRPLCFLPTFQKHMGQTCGGCQIHVVDRRQFRPVDTAVAVLSACRSLDPARWSWRQPPYEYETRKMPIDILYGSGALRNAIDADTSPEGIVEGWREPLARFLDVRERVLLY